jgi:uncharacterized membrane protein YgdD (TMEM256/DUF423 family)
VPRTLASLAPAGHVQAMFRIAWMFGSISAFIGVAAGAFGAHALKARIDPAMLLVYETGVRYQLIHAIALLAVGLAAARLPAGRWSIPVGLFVAGTVLFSGSLYALALSGMRWLGAVTPLGGVCFLLGWLAVTWIASRVEV